MCHVSDVTRRDTSPQRNCNALSRICASGLLVISQSNGSFPFLIHRFGVLTDAMS